MLLAASIEDLFATDSGKGEQALERSIIPGELVVGYQSDGIDPNDDDSLSKLIEHLERSLPNEQEVLASELFQLDEPSEQPLNLFHFRFEAGSDLLELATHTMTFPGVAWVAPNFQYAGNPKEFVPDDPLYGSQYHHSLIGSESAWDTTLGDPGVIIAILDDGVETLHPDLNANIWRNAAELLGTPGVDDDNNGFVDDFVGWDFVSDDNDPNRLNIGDDHGSAVAGVAAGVTNNNLQIAGVAGGSTIMPLRIGGDDGGYTSTILADSLAYAIDNGAKIANLSYDTDEFFGDPTFTAGLQYYHDNGGILFGSAGNSNQLNPTRQGFEQTILVASTDSGDEKSSSSNFGTGIDIAAPGDSILTTDTDGGTVTRSGTSMASGVAAGAAALIWSAKPTWTRDQVIAYLLATADSIDAANPTYVGYLGSGRINVGDLDATLAPPQVSGLTGLPGDGQTIAWNLANDQFSLRFDQLMHTAGSEQPGVLFVDRSGAQ